MADIINIEILEDGTISLKTTEISETNHMSADQLLQDFETLLGGKMEFKPNPEAKAKAHIHRHEHAYTGGHSHDDGKSFHRH